MQVWQGVSLSSQVQVPTILYGLLDPLVSFLRGSKKDHSYSHNSLPVNVVGLVDKFPAGV